MIQQTLRAPDGERRNNHRAAATQRAFDQIGENGFDRATVMQTIAIGGFDQKIIRVVHRRGIGHCRIAIASEIAGKDDFATAPGEFDDRRAKNMAGAPQPDFGTLFQFMDSLESQRLKQPQRMARIVCIVCLLYTSDAADD